MRLLIDAMDLNYIVSALGTNRQTPAYPRDSYLKNGFELICSGVQQTRNSGPFKCLAIKISLVK